MKICHFIASSQFGGAERVVINLCSEMSQEHDVHLIVFGAGKHLNGLDKGVTLHTVKEFKRYNLIAMYHLARKIKEINPDIVHTHGAKASRIMLTISKWLKVPFVATKHNARKGKVFNRLRDVIAVSKQVKESIRGVGECRIIYNGITPVRIRKRKTDESRINEQKEALLHICAVGRLDPIKGFDRLIDAVSALDFPFRLDIIGEGKERKRLQEQIDRLGIEEQVKLCGHQEGIPELMADADVVVISSHSEGFSLVMVEALFYANILVSTPVSGATEVLEERFLMSPDHIREKIIDIHQNKDTYVEAFSQLKERMQEQFLLPEVTKKHIDYYTEVIRKSQQ
jgi:glycosyltransferase involved in cell wall biosynthesis